MIMPAETDVVDDIHIEPPDGHLGRVGLGQHIADRSQPMRHDRQRGSRPADVLRHDVHLVSARQEHLRVLIGPLFRAAAARVEVIDDQGDFHGSTPASIMSCERA